MLKGFRDFILRGDVVSLAVAVVIGAAFNNIVNALVKDFITPLIGLFGGQTNFAGFAFTINHNKFMLGDFINAIISFVIVAAVIYFAVVIPMNKVIERIKEGEKVDPTEKACPQCLSLIPVKAKRCKFCTSVITK